MEEGLKLDYMRMESWSVLGDIVKYVQHNQTPIGHYGLGAKAPEKRYSTNIYKQLNEGERSRK